MSPISGRRETFSQGRLDNVDLKFSDTRWELKEGSTGKETARLVSTLVDADGNEHPWNWTAIGGIDGDKKSRLTVVDGRLVAVNEDGDESEDGALADFCGAAKLFDALGEYGFSPKKLDKIGDDPSVLDDTICHFEQKSSGQKSKDGTKEFSDLLPTAILDEEEFGGGGGKKKKPASTSTSTSTSGTTSKKKTVVEDEDEDEPPARKGTAGKARAADAEESDESNDSDSDDDSDTAADAGSDDDEVTDLATTTAVKIISDPEEYVKNYNPKKNGGGLQLKEMYIAGVTLVKGKQKSAVLDLLRDAKFHRTNAKAKLYQFDAENGVVTPNPAKGGKR